jgi:hypothetical protein
VFCILPDRYLETKKNPDLFFQKNLAKIINVLEYAAKRCCWPKRFKIHSSDDPSSTEIVQKYIVCELTHLEVYLIIEVFTNDYGLFLILDRFT